MRGVSREHQGYTHVSTHPLLGNVAAAAAAVLLAGDCLGREVTDQERNDVWNAVRRYVADDQILKVDAYWGELDGVSELEALVTTRPFEVGEGLCATEAYRLRRRQGEESFRRINAEAPISQYWERNVSCDVIDAEVVNEFGRIPNTVEVAQRIATTHVATIIRSADEILGLASPAVRCNERIMAELFRPDVKLRLTGIELDRRNMPGSGIQYTAWYTRANGRNNDGVTVRFAILPDHFEVSFACYWIA
jgi:hypothetical protein